jgi:hypothetical protein
VLVLAEPCVRGAAPSCSVGLTKNQKGEGMPPETMF